MNDGLRVDSVARTIRSAAFQRAADLRVMLIMLIITFMTCTTALIGCQDGLKDTTPPKDEAPRVEAPLPEYFEVASVYNRRIDQLVETYARGVVELRWIDEDGNRHMEPQVDLDLWVNLPRHTSFRMEKLGELLLWAGSDDASFWLFDLIDTPTTLRIGTHDELAHAGNQSMMVQPLRLLDLMAFARMPRVAGGPSPMSWSDDKLLRVETVADGRHTAAYLDPQTLLPYRIELFGPEGTVIASSELRRFRRVSQRGVLVLNQPFVPSLLDIDFDDGAASLRIALSDPDSYSDNQPIDVVFDRESLAVSIQPDRVIQWDQSD
jgi:hypothetical protein